MQTFWQDLRYAGRTLARKSGGAAAVLTLAAGAGVSGALAGLAHAVPTCSVVTLLVTLALLFAACVNAAYLLVERSVGRRREIAIRAALGASRGRLVRQLLTESLLVGAWGGALGLVLAIWAIALVIKSGSAGAAAATIHLDARVMAYTLVFSLAGGVVLGLLPAWDFSRADRPALGREFGRVTLPGRLRGRGLLAVAEMALAAVLLASTGGMLRGIARGENLRLEALMSGGAALVAMAQAGLGLYGAMSWSVVVRTPEFRIRVALGARAADMQRLVLRQGLRLALEGTLLGLVAGWVLAPHPAGPAVLLSVSVLLTGVAMLACCVPARRAAQVDPLAAVRYE